MSAESVATHVGELTLRRLRAGELEGAEAARAKAHTEDCGHCRARLRALDEEQRSFEQTISFERFQAGVTRATRQPSPAATTPKARWLYPVMAMAAMVALVVLGEPMADLLGGPERPITRLKGGAGIDVRIASGNDGPQRSATADAPEPLGPGERVRIGYQAGEHSYVLALSIDQNGVVTPLYPESGQSLPVQSTASERMEYLPDSLEFTGAGAETVLVVLSDTPLDVAEVRAAAERAFEEAGRDVTRVRTLDVGPHAEVFHRTVLKP
ncbi:MAG: DUF4384 domain-containing protein [Myxococcaceae bacterium]|nr:DUF4384 domain-containing protein [Myxococcaceae bacterium]